MQYSTFKELCSQAVSALVFYFTMFPVVEDLWRIMTRNKYWAIVALINSIDVLQDEAKWMYHVLMFTNFI